MQVLVTSQHASDKPVSTWATVYFTPVSCFLAFNCGDYLGRVLAATLQQPGTSVAGQTLTLVLSVVRTGSKHQVYYFCNVCVAVFIPLFMLCNAAPTIRNLPVVFRTDADYYALMALFSVSNGYLGNLCMMQGPKAGLGPNEDITTTITLKFCGQF